MSHFDQAIVIADDIAMSALDIANALAALRAADKALMDDGISHAGRLAVSRQCWDAQGPLISALLTIDAPVTP